MSFGFGSFNLQAAKQALNSSLTIVEEARHRIDKVLDIETDEKASISSSKNAKNSDNTINSTENNQNENNSNTTADGGLSLSNLQSLSDEELNDNKDQLKNKIINNETEKNKIESSSFDRELSFDKKIKELDEKSTKTILSNANGDGTSLAAYYTENITGSLLSSFIKKQISGATSSVQAPKKEDLLKTPDKSKISKTTSNNLPNDTIITKPPTENSIRTISSEHQPIFANEHNLLTAYLQGSVEDEEADFDENKQEKLENLDQENQKLESDIIKIDEALVKNEERRKEEIRKEEERIEQEKIQKEEREKQEEEMRKRKLEEEEENKMKLEEEEDQVSGKTEDEQQHSEVNSETLMGWGFIIQKLVSVSLTPTDSTFSNQFWQ